MNLSWKTWRKPFILHDLQAVKPIVIKCKVIAAIEATLAKPNYPPIRAAYLLLLVVNLYVRQLKYILNNKMCLYEVPQKTQFYLLVIFFIQN